jgi:SAM-dependent methyltransferase
METFDTAAVFNEDFSYFYAERVGASRTAGDAALLHALGLPGAARRVLDLCCGEGRLSEVLAGEGAAVIGIDRSLGYLSEARVAGELVCCSDMSALPFRAAFDLVCCWYTSFGYFDDETNRTVLSEVRRALRPGGALLLDLDSKAHLERSRLATQTRERGDDLMVEQFRLDPSSSRIRAMRTVVRDGEVRRSSYFVRLFGDDELREWLSDCGFVDIELFDEHAAPYSRATSRRMVAIARRPPRPAPRH